MDTIRACVLSEGEPAYWLQRTLRSLDKKGIEHTVIRRDSGAAVEGAEAEVLRSGQPRGLWVLRAGAWLISEQIACPAPSATGRPLAALGAVRFPPEAVNENRYSDAGFWRAVLRQSNGDLQTLFLNERKGQQPASVWFDSALADEFIQNWRAGRTVSEALVSTLTRPGIRTIHWKPFDVCVDERLRVVQIITSLQRGGAERVALSLHECWQRDAGLSPFLISLGQASRDHFQTPAQAAVFENSGTRLDRVRACIERLSQHGADLIHSHLLTADEMRVLAEARIPHVTTIHNAKRGWPAGLESVNQTHVNLMIACSKAVETELAHSGIEVPVRTIWNGIADPQPPITPDRRRAERAVVRKWMKIPEDALVLISVANIRPQKRLERIPPIMVAIGAHLREVGIMRDVHLLLVGERSSAGIESMNAEMALKKSISDCELEGFTHWTSSVSDPVPFLCAADILISVSDYEGLSLSHLEAMAVGLPVVACSAGGTAEIGTRAEGLHVLPAEASSADFAEKICQVVTSEPQRSDTTEESKATPRPRQDFTLKAMSERYRLFYRRAVSESMSEARRGLLLVINNLSTGGAQSSAVRLLLELHRRGWFVRAVVLQEDRSNPTPGRRQLQSAGVEVLVLPKAGTTEPRIAVSDLLEATTDRPPEVILLWNTLPSYKVQIADQAIGCRIYDVSPGEMNFESLASYFQRPLPGLPYRCESDYGQRLTGSIVKYSAEQTKAAQVLKTRVHVIPNGVPISERSVDHGHRAVVAFGTSARINPQKRLEDLLQAFRILIQRGKICELKIAGGVEAGCEEYADRLLSMSADLPVQWLGHVDNVRTYLLSLDVFVMISRPAGCPNASLEAMAVGLPVIATDYGGAGEQVDHRSGRIVIDGNPESLASAMYEFASNAELRAEAGLHAKERALAMYSIDRMADRYSFILQGTLDAMTSQEMSETKNLN
ncbi:MAG: glycosyltransferase family 4 protein [Planctomyces sp.]|nr:glycosyltransferase family 4 protein [Planctomyces sp.]